MRALPFAGLLVVGTALLLLALAACDGDSPSETTPTPHFAQGTPFGHPCPSGYPGHGVWLLSGLSLDGVSAQMAQSVPITFPQGEPITMTLAMTNCSSVMERVSYRSSQRYDFLVEDSSGREVWRWSRDKVFAQVVSEEPLKSVIYTEVWDQRSNDGEQVPPGRYQARAVNLACDDISQQDVRVLQCEPGASLTFEITP